MAEHKAVKGAALVRNCCSCLTVFIIHSFFLVCLPKNRTCSRLPHVTLKLLSWMPMLMSMMKQPLSMARSVIKQTRPVATYESYVCHRGCTHRNAIKGALTLARSSSYSTTIISANIVIPGSYWQGGSKYYNNHSNSARRKSYHQRPHPTFFTAMFSTSKTERPEEGSLRDAVHKIQQEGQRNAEVENNKGDTGSNTAAASSSGNYDHIIQKALSLLDTFKSGLAQTWEELINSGKPQSVNKVIHAPMGGSAAGSGTDGGGNVDNEAADKYDGVAALTIVKENSGAWERMQQRLAEAPIIKDILGASYELYKKSGAQHAKRKLDDIRADATEAWETSQNPWIYRLSSVYDTITAESEFALATKELRRLDPDFVSLDKFKDDAMATMIPEILAHIMEGRTKELKPHLGEAVYNRLAAEIRVRKSEGLIVDPHILGIENSEILAAEIDENNRGSPIVLVHFMCQQINCVRNKEGVVVEGGEDEIRANSYIVALQREYNDEEGALNWKMVDFRFNGGIPWI